MKSLLMVDEIELIYYLMSADIFAYVSSLLRGYIFTNNLLPRILKTKSRVSEILVKNPSSFHRFRFHQNSKNDIQIITHICRTNAAYLTSIV